MLVQSTVITQGTGQSSEAFSSICEKLLDNPLFIELKASISSSFKRPHHCQRLLESSGNQQLEFFGAKLSCRLLLLAASSSSFLSAWRYSSWNKAVAQTSRSPAGKKCKSQKYLWGCPDLRHDFATEPTEPHAPDTGKQMTRGGAGFDVDIF